MKKSKIALLGLISLSLMGCNKITDSVVSENTADTVNTDDALPVESKSEEKTDTEEPVTTDAPAASDSEKVPSSDGAGESAPVTTDKGEESSGSDSESVQATDYYVGWTQEQIALMQQYLGGTVLPYLDFFGSGAYMDYDAGSYSSDPFLGYFGTSPFNAATLTVAKAIYEACGYTCTISGSQLDCINAATGIEVIIFDDEGFPTLKATWAEPFDPTLATAWTADILQAFQDHLHGHVLPFVYLGTVNPTVSVSSSSGLITIEGGAWDDQIGTLFQGAYTLTDSWTVTTDTDYYYNTEYTGVKTFGDGCVVTVVLSQDYSGDTEFEVSYVEPWNPPVNGAWQQDVLDLFNQYFDRHVLPYIYLGTSNVTTTDHWSNRKEWDLNGGAWHDEVLTLAASTYTEADGWVATSANSATKFAYKKTFDDDCKIEIRIYKNYSDKITMEMYFIEGFKAPAAGATWSQDVLDKFNDIYAGHNLPYIYLGTSNPSVKTFDLTSGDKEINFTGSAWDNQVVALTKTSLEDDGYTVFENTDTTGYESYALMFYKTFDDGFTIYGRLYDYESSYSGSSIMLYTSLAVPLTYTNTAWNSDVTTAMTTNLAGYSLPYFYLGDGETASYSDYTGKLTIKGDSGFNFNMILKAKEALETAGYTAAFEVEKATYSASLILKASKVDDTYGTFNLKFNYSYYTSSYSDAKVEIDFIEKFDPTAKTEWSADTLTMMNTNFENHVIPYVYLGKKNEKATMKKGVMTITGSFWNDQITQLFKTAFTPVEGGYAWTVTEGTDPKLGAIVTATAPLEVLNSSITAKLYQTNTGEADSKACIDISYEGGFDPSSCDAWTTEINDAFTAHLGGNQLPYIYLGSTAPTVNYTSPTLTITGKTWDDSIVASAKTSLEAAGYICNVKRNSYGLLLGAYKKTADGSYVRVVIRKAGASDADGAILEAYYDAALTTAIPTGAWEADATTAFNKYLGGHTIPYFYLGTSTYNAYGNEKRMNMYKYSIGSSWSNQLVYNAFDVLCAAGWRMSLDPTDSEFGPAIYGSVINDDNTKSIIKLSPSSSGSGFEMYVSNDCAYDNTSITDYSEDIKSKLKSNLGIENLPFIYLGATVYTSDYSYTENRLRLTGDRYEEIMLSEAVAKFTADTTRTWSVHYEYTKKCGKTLVATAANADGTYITMKLYNGGEVNYGYELPTLDIYVA